MLEVSGENPAIYRLDDATSYVRAKVVDSRGAVSWVQPVFVERPEPRLDAGLTRLPYQA